MVKFGFYEFMLEYALSSFHCIHPYTEFQIYQLKISKEDAPAPGQRQIS